MSDIYQRIYDKCQDTALFRTMLTVVQTALDYAEKKGDPDHPFVCGNEFWSGGLDKIKEHGMHFDLLHDVRQLAETLSKDYAAQFGPCLSVEGPARASMKEPHILAFGFDDDLPKLCPFALPSGLEWNDSGLEQAASAYRRAGHWDFAPGEAGIWLLYYLITEGHGGEEGNWWYNGNLVGFAILYDRNKDGHYESLGHIWTASAARRRGVATALIAYARKHFLLRTIEYPLTDDGAALFKRAWPEILAPKDHELAEAIERDAPPHE
jgi:ribosomal protein S18 acetylase RimI-like enzyme